MTKVQEISHLCQMISGNVHHSNLSINGADFGYLTRLKDIVAQGGFAADNTLEEMELARAAAQLRLTADAIEQTRAALIDNTTNKITHGDIKCVSTRPF